MKEQSAGSCFCTNLRRAAAAISDSYDIALKALGLTVAQYRLLITLSRVEPVDTTSFAESVGLDRSTLVRNIRVLQKNGWVEDAARGVKHQFHLTKAGRALLAKAAPAWEKVQSEFTDYLGGADAAELMRLLLKVQEMK